MSYAYDAPRLLAVDDDVSSAELIVRVAERCGFEAFATSDSRGVVSLVEALAPAVLCVDICMPNIDAIELFDLLVKNSYRGRILIVSGQDVSILESTARLGAGRGLDVIACLQKPFDLTQLRQLLMQQQQRFAEAS
ncbi:MAG: response regulator [Hyphomicrobiaceae bacterium]|nr:response regulator [Hyphomicrobiaceae bacterium]